MPDIAMAKNILVADDDPLLGKLFTRVLRDAGHVVTSVAHGEQALALAAQGGFTVAFLDIDMPGRSGWEIATALRSEPTTAGMLLVAISGRISPADLERSSVAGFDVHLMKPVMIADLLAAAEAHRTWIPG